MTICMLNTFRYRRGGDSAYALGLEERLSARGHEVLPFAMHHPEELSSPHSSHFATEIDYPDLLSRGGLANSLKVIQSSIYNREARRRISGLFDSHQVALVHAHSVMHHLTASVMLECYGREIPVVWTLHDLKSVCPTSLFLRDGRICESCSGGSFYKAALYRCKRRSLGASLIVTAELYLHRLWRVYEKADLLIAPSQFLRDKILESGLKPRRIEVLHNYVDTEAIDPPRNTGGYVLYVGRISREKGVANLMESCVRASLPLHIAGTGELLPELEAYASRHGWSDVSFHGHCTGAELSALYRDASLVAVPSEWQENCPLVVLEAFAWGKPVLASRLGGLVELVGERGVGELLPPGDTEAWAEALERWGSNPRLCREAGDAAREHAENNFAAERHLDRLEGLYDEVLGASAHNAVGAGHEP